MKLSRLFLLLGLLFCFQSIHAQSYLLIRKKGSKRRYEYREGDYIIYKQQGMTEFFRDRITEFADSTIVMENNIILTSQLVEVNVSNAFTNRPPLLRKAEGILPAAGYGLMALDIFNHTVIDGQDFSLDERTTITSAVLVGTGYGLRLFRRKKIDLTNPNFEAYIVGF